MYNFGPQAKGSGHIGSRTFAYFKWWQKLAWPLARGANKQKMATCPFLTMTNDFNQTVAHQV